MHQKKGISITVTQKDPEALSRFRKVFGIGTIYPPSKNNSCYRYYAYGIEATLVLSLMLPYLTVKKGKAIEAIQAQTLRRPRAKNNTSMPTSEKQNKLRLDKARLVEIVSLRNSGFTFAAISLRYGISRQRIHQLYVLAKTHDLLSSNPALC